MSRHQLILPRADSACGKTFYDDRRTADSHRIALEFWNQATGRTRAGYRLAVSRCKRCGGYHIGRRRIEQVPPRPEPSAPTECQPVPEADFDYVPRVRKVCSFVD
jgi:hypothetical protein